MNLSSHNIQKDINYIFQSLSLKDKQYLCNNYHGGDYKFYSQVVSRRVLYAQKIPIAFEECIPWNLKSKNVAFISLAVSPQYRRRNLTKLLLNLAIHDLKMKNYKKIVARCDSSNINSIRVWQANGFKQTVNSKNYYSFELIIRK